MALQINKQNKIYELNGSLTADQVFELGRFFNLKLHLENELIISLKKLDTVDISAALMFKQLFSQAAMRNKKCTIRGLKNHKIHGAFRHTEQMHVLSA
ncbi:hypothetical protein [Gilvibacter sp.]|uniref:hypothetical protein n=1 Tax=Gilvibacter sp. TaxID=2729997 RepID=UPI0025C08B0E|nr:hypothetical protein [Gilvibacter sp.]NQX78003.1 hypothetical protein [Gilvibacter sp.]